MFLNRFKGLYFKGNRLDDIFRLLGRYVFSLNLLCRSIESNIFLSPVSVYRTHFPLIIPVFMFHLDLLYLSDMAKFCCGQCGSSE